MKVTTDCGLDCFRQLLTNFAASGFVAAATAASYVGIAGPAAAGVLCVAAYVGLSRCWRGKGEKDAEKAGAALKLLRDRSVETREDLAELSQDLARLGFDLSRDHDAAMRELREIRAKLEEVSRLPLPPAKAGDEEILAFLRREEGLLVSLGTFLERNFDELREMGVRTQATIEEVRNSVFTLRYDILELRKDFNGLATLIVEKYERSERDLRDLSEERAKRIADLEAALREAKEQAGRGDDEAERAIKAIRDTGDLELLQKVIGRFADERYAREQDRYLQSSREVASIAYTRGDIEESVKRLKKILAIRPDDLDAINRMGNIHLLRGELDDAAACYRRVLELAAGDESWVAAAYGNLGLVYATRGDLDGAEAMHKKSLAIEEKLGRLKGMATDYGNLGLVCKTRGDLDGAEAMHKKALVIDEKLGRLEGMANQCGNLGLVYQTRGDLDRAEEMHKKALAIEEKLGRLEGIAANYGGLGLVHQGRGQLAMARECGAKSVELFRRLGAMDRAAVVQQWLDGLGQEEKR